ncbi:MAG: hypothetical protein KGY66_05675 [Candidatus Thermoplasmatota archaeon]|nr:hypothetical protein [Candidatus Thermoplasmatota archaeon]MBS3790387.1 hypothetical protein [Candidatus Thermoplasmatota archaeon]
MELGVWTFVTVLLLTLGLGLLLSGVFTAYFGRGKSRTVGIILAIIGILVWIGSYAGYYGDYFGTTTFGDVLIYGLHFVGAFVVGALIAIGIFLVAIMKT